MTREEFLIHTNEALRSAMVWAAEQLGKPLPMEYCVAWLGARDAEIVCSEMAEYIASRVYEGPDRIRPCVDLLVSELLDDGRALIRVYVAGYEPTSLGRNWSGREGPYVFGYGEKLKNQLAG
jgi:hypothetical protein